MAYNADSVVATVETRLDQASNKAAEAQFDQSMNRIKGSADNAEKALQRLFDPVNYRQERLRSAVVGTGKAVEGAFDRPMLNATTRTRQLGVQIGQLGSSAVSGGSLLSAFGQQASDFAYTLAGTKGVAGSLATFFSGPWGAALLAAGLVVGQLATRHHEADAAAEGHKKAEKSLQEAIADLDKTTREAIQSQQERNRLTELTVQQQLAAAVATRAHTAEVLRQAIAQEQLFLSTRGAPVNEYAAQTLNQATQAAHAHVNELNTMLAENEKAVDQAQRALAQAAVPRLLQQASEATDKAAKATGEYERALAHLEQQQTSGAITNKVFEARAAALMKIRDAALEAARAEKRHKEAVEGVAEVYNFKMPVSGPITSGFGPRTPPTKGASSFHPAIDIAAPEGTAVHAAAPGVVIRVGKLGGLGNVVIVDHGGGTISEYGHLSAILAKAGQEVTPDTVIGKVGSTGISTGPHLDYRVRVGGRYVDPRKGKFKIDTVGTASGAIDAQEKADDLATRQTDTFNAEMLRFQEQIVAATRGRVTSTEQQLEIDEAQVAIDRDQQIQAIEAGVAQERITDAQGKILIEKANQLATDKVLKLYLDEGVRKAQMNAALDVDRAETKVDAARFDEDMARNAADHRDAANRVLEAELELERLKQQQIADNTKIGSVEHERAMLALDDINRRRSEGQARIARDPSNMTSGQRYLDELNSGTWQDAVDDTAVDALKRFNDEISKAITGTESLGEMWRNIGDLIVEQLIRIAVQEMIIKPIAGLLFGGSGGGGISSILSLFGGGGGGAASGAGAMFGDAMLSFAGGGMVRAGVPIMVGESGKEAFVPSTDGQIINNQTLRNSLGGEGGGGVVEIHVVGGEMFDARVARVSGDVSVKVLTEAVPRITDLAAAKTLISSSRRKM